MAFSPPIAASDLQSDFRLKAEATGHQAVPGHQAGESDGVVSRSRDSSFASAV
jgi:hypothetical protein